MRAGTLIGGKYELLRPLGRGAMGEVWAAINRSTDGEVALKLLMPGADPEVRRRLLREAKACGRLRHRTIVEIYDVGETAGGEPFLVMQLLHGETLAQRLRRSKTLPVDVAVGIACDVATALRHAHERAIVHRDLKPANIFLHQEPDTEGTQTKVVDFGVSKLAIENEGESAATMAGSLLGSPAYMSPEQARAAHVDGRSDLWALGVLLFEMIAGKRPFRGQTGVEVIGELLGKGPIARVETVAPHVNPRLGDVIAACLTRDLDQRVASAADLLRLLRPFGPREQFGTNQGGSHHLHSSTTDAREPPPLVMPATRAPQQRLSPPPIAAPSRESVTSFFQPQRPASEEDASSDSMDATIMRAAPELRPAAAGAHDGHPRSTLAHPPEADEPPRDSMEAATGMFSPQALLAPLYDERESQEPTARVVPEAADALNARIMPYSISESSRPTAEIPIDGSRPKVSGERANSPAAAITPGAQRAYGGTLPMQPGFIPPLPSQRAGQGDEDWRKQTAPLDLAAHMDPRAWKKQTARLAPGHSPASPSAPDWRKQRLAFEPAAPAELPATETALWQPLPGSGAATSTSPVLRSNGAVPRPAEMGPAPRGTSRLMIALIACSIALVVASLLVVALTIHSEKPAPARNAAGAPTASASASSSAPHGGGKP